MQSDLLSLDEAINKIKSSFQKISNEDIFLKDALGRCLAKPIISQIDNPKYDVSSMDGYAVNHKDFIKVKDSKIKKFKIVGESSAGVPYSKKINFNSLRRGEVVGEHEVKFSSGKEIITLNHEAFDRALYSEGALTAAKWLINKEPGLYSMRDVLNFK